MKNAAVPGTSRLWIITPHALAPEADLVIDQQSLEVHEGNLFVLRVNSLWLNELRMYSVFVRLDFPGESV